MLRKIHGCGCAVLVLAGSVAFGQDFVTIANPNWAINMTDEGYSDVALDLRPGFVGREYLSGEWAAAIVYAGGSNPSGPIWLRKDWIFPDWTTNSNFTVDQKIMFDVPATNGDGFNRLFSRISNGDVEITIRYEMVDTLTGTPQGDERASNGGPGSSIASDRYVFMQKYEVRNISGGPLTDVRFYHFLHGLETGISLYDNRPYTGPLSAYRYDNTQKGTSRSFHTGTGEIYSHDDTICMHAMVAPSAIECGYYGIEGVDSHALGKPGTGTHLSIEADSLNGLDYFEPPEKRWVSGGMCFDFPNLANGEVHEITVLFSVHTESSFVGPAPVIRIVDARIDGSEFVIDFEATSAAELGFILRTSKDLSQEYPNKWPSAGVPYFIDTPMAGQNRFVVPIDTATNPKCFFGVQGVLK